MRHLDAPHRKTVLGRIGPHRHEALLDHRPPGHPLGSRPRWTAAGRSLCTAAHGRTIGIKTTCRYLCQAHSSRAHGQRQVAVPRRTRTGAVAFALYHAQQPPYGRRDRAGMGPHPPNCRPDRPETARPPYGATCERGPHTRQRCYRSTALTETCGAPRAMRNNQAKEPTVCRCGWRAEARASNGAA